MIEYKVIECGGGEVLEKALNDAAMDDWRMEKMDRLTFPKSSQMAPNRVQIMEKWTVVFSRPDPARVVES